MRHPILILTAALLLAGCAHAGKGNDASAGRANEQASQGSESETIDDALAVELDERGEKDDEQQEPSEDQALDSRFWEQSDGISSDTVFGDAEPSQQASPDSGAVDKASRTVARARSRGRHDVLVAAISAAPGHEVEQILRWRAELRRLSPRARGTLWRADLETLRRGFEHAVAGEDWSRILELDEVLTRYRADLDGNLDSVRRETAEELAELVRWKQPLVVAAYHHLGERARVNQMVAGLVMRAQRDPFAKSVELAERLAELGADEVSRELLGADVLESAFAVRSHHGHVVSPEQLETGLRVLGTTGGENAVVELWARRYLQAKAGFSVEAFRTALNTCTEYVDDEHCRVETPITSGFADAAADLRLACRYYQFRRDWTSVEAARQGYLRYVEACGDDCRQKMDSVAFEEALCSAGAMSTWDAPDVYEALVAVPLQFGDLELAAELMARQSAHPISKARVMLEVRPSHRFLPNAAVREALIDRVVVWIEEAETLAESRPEEFPGDETPEVALAELRVRAAELAAEVGLERRAVELIAGVRGGVTEAPRVFGRATSLLVDLGHSDRAADLIVASLRTTEPRQFEPWVAPLTRELTPRHALRVYRAAAAAGFSKMAAEGLALAVEENDLPTARILVDAAGSDSGPREILTGASRSRLEQEARVNPQWAEFYLSVLRRKPVGQRSRLDRIRIARVVGDSGEPKEALAQWESVFDSDPMPCATLNIALRDGPSPQVVEALIRHDHPSKDDSAKRLMLSMMLRMRMRLVDGEPLEIDPRFRSRVASLARRIMEESPMVCASPIGFADILAGHGFPEAALEVLDATRERGIRKDRHGVPIETVQQRYLEMRVALDIDDVGRAREAIDRVETSRDNLRRSLQRELGWYLMERGDVDEAAELLDKSLFSLERMYVEEARAPTDYEPLRHWRVARTSIERVDETVVALARLRVEQGRGEAFSKKLSTLLSRSSLDSVRRRRLALRLMSEFDHPSQRAEVLQAMETFGLEDRLWMLGARSELVEGNVDRGFAKFDMRASRLASPYSFWVEQAYWFVGRGEFDLARRAMERARRLGGDGPGLAVARGRIALLRGEDETAMREFRDALRQLHLRTTVERRVVDALEDVQRDDLRRTLEAEGLLDRAGRTGASDPTLRFKRLQSALQDRKPGAALAEFVAIASFLQGRGQLEAHARSVADLVASSGHPGSHEFFAVLVQYDLSDAALILVEAEAGPNLEDAFRLWAYLSEGVVRNGVELALQMLDPASDKYSPGDSLRLVGAFDYHEALLTAGRQSVERLGLLSSAAPYVVDTLLVRGELDKALAQVQRTAQLVESRRDTLTSAQLQRWSAIQARLVERGLAAEAQAVLGYAPFVRHHGAIERPRPRQQDAHRSLWRRMDALPELNDAANDRSAGPWLPTPAQLAHESLGDLAPGLLRASGPFAKELVADKPLQARIEGASGHAPVQAAWIITLYEAGEMERARLQLRNYLKARAEDVDAVERMVEHLGQRGFWSELAVVAAPLISRESPETALWLQRARAEIGVAEAADVRSAGSVREVLGRPFARAPHVDDVLFDALSSDVAHVTSGTERMRALRSLGPLEQWCTAPDALDTVLAFARVRRAPELEQLEACWRVRSEGAALTAAGRGYGARLAAFREGTRLGIMSPSDFHTYRVLRWRLGR